VRPVNPIGWIGLRPVDANFQPFCQFWLSTTSNLLDLAVPVCPIIHHWVGFIIYLASIPASGLYLVPIDLITEVHNLLTAPFLRNLFTCSRYGSVAPKTVL
jgi:hypothetical protein